MKYVIIIGATFGGFFVLALATICLVRFKKKKTLGRKRLGLGVMPQEEAFPNPEKYELENTKSMENIIYFEKVGVSAKTDGGKSNEAFD